MESVLARPALEVEGLRKVFPGGGSAVRVAVDGVSFAVMPGECVGIVGESGSGKSTVANMVLRLLDPTEGKIVLEGVDITHAKGRELRRAYRTVQAVFQDPAGSFDPRRTLLDGVTEGMRNAGMSKESARVRASELAREVGLDEGILARHPREVSGGQCQRAAIARALALDPSLLVCDEATSALDVTVQSQIVGLIARLRKERKMAVLFICHDIALVQNVCDRVIVMQDGKVAEEGDVASVLTSPQSDCARELLSCVL